MEIVTSSSIRVKPERTMSAQFLLVWGSEPEWHTRFNREACWSLY